MADEKPVEKPAEPKPAADHVHDFSATIENPADPPARLICPCGASKRK